MCMKNEPRASRRGGRVIVGKEGRKGKERAIEGRDFYTLRKRRRARARALPDAGVAISSRRLVV